MKPNLTRADIRRIEKEYLFTLDAVGDELANGMKRSLGQLNREVEKAFKKYLHKMELNPVTQHVLDTPRNRSLMRALRSKLDAERQIYLLAQGKRLTGKAVKEGFRAGAKRAGQMYGASLKIGAPDARRLSEYTRLSHEYITALDRQTGDHIRHVLTRGRFEGWNPRRIANEIVEGGKLKAGRVHTVETRAELWARTEPVRVAEETHMNKFVEVSGQGDPYGQWISILDTRSGQDSRKRHGKLLRKSQWMNKNFPGDKYQGIPPIRPNDRCSIQWLDPEDWTSDQWAAIQRGTPWYNVGAPGGEELQEMAAPKATEKPEPKAAAPSKPRVPQVPDDLDGMKRFAKDELGVDLQLDARTLEKHKDNVKFTLGHYAEVSHQNPAWVKTNPSLQKLKLVTGKPTDSARYYPAQKTIRLSMNNMRVWDEYPNSAIDVATRTGTVQKVTLPDGKIVRQKVWNSPTGDAAKRWKMDHELGHAIDDRMKRFYNEAVKAGKVAPDSPAPFRRWLEVSQGEAPLTQYVEDFAGSAFNRVGEDFADHFAYSRFDPAVFASKAPKRRKELNTLLKLWFK